MDSENETTRDYDLDALLGGSVASIEVKFPDLSDNQLALLKDKEADAEKPRVSLIASIDNEIKARAQASEGDELEALRKEVAELRKDKEALAKLLAASAGDAGAGGDDFVPTNATVLVIGDEAPLSGRIVFGDENDHLIERLAALTFDKGAFLVEADGSVILDRPISFPTFEQAQIINAVWLVEEGDDGALVGAVSRMLAPFQVGGGINAELPKGHLRFSAAPKKAEEQAA